MSSSQAHAGAGAVPDRGQVDDHGDVVATTAGVALGVLVDTNDGDAVETVVVIDQQPVAFGEDGVVGGVPGDAEPGRDPGDREVLKTASPSSAHRSTRRDSLARGSAARLVSCRQTWPQPVHR